MITLITGKPGSGKTALLTAFCNAEFRNNNVRILNDCRSYINQLNASRRTKLTLPEKTPIYTDFNIRIPCGYKKFYEPYYINGFFIGLKNETLPNMALPPFSKIFLQEVGKYFDSRKKNLPDWVSRFFEQHRHFHLDFYLDLQRGMLVDKNIRAIAGRIIEIQDLTHETDKMKNIKKSTWSYYEFTSAEEYEQYLNEGAVAYTKKTFTHVGNIFRLYNSFNCATEFIPDEDGDFSYLPYRSAEEIKNLPKNSAILYSTSAPKGYWSQEPSKEGKENGSKKQTQ